MDTSAAAKGLTGCSGCAVLVFLALTVLVAIGGGVVYDLTGGKVSPDELAPVGLVSSSCCCLSSVGVLVGVVLLLVGGRRERV